MSFAGAETAAPPAEVPWGPLVPVDQWSVFRSAASTLEDLGVPYLLHGAMALAAYTGRWRNTKDIDLILQPADHERAIDAVRRAGFEDYAGRESYDPSWIFRAYRDGMLVDLIWDLPNHRVAIDDEAFEQATSIRLRGHDYATVSAEDLIRMKLYVMQRERCDWVDVLNVLASRCGDIDWPRLTRRMGRDAGLLHGALALFNWLCPARAKALPGSVRERFALPLPDSDDRLEMDDQRVVLLDSRPWFAPHQPRDRPLER